MNQRERANQKRRERYAIPQDRLRRGWNLVQITCPACGKKCYATRGDAKRAARQSHGGRARVYRCGDWWHLTSWDAATVTDWRERDQA